MKPIKLKFKKDGDETYRIVDSTKARKRRLIEMKTWKNTGSPDVLHVLNKYKRRIEVRCISHLDNDQPIKFYVTLKVLLVKTDFKTGENHYEYTHFHSGTKTLLSKNEFDEIFKQTTNKIWDSLDAWMRNGSGYRVESIDLVQLSIFK